MSLQIIFIPAKKVPNLGGLGWNLDFFRNTKFIAVEEDDISPMETLRKVVLIPRSDYKT